MLAPRLAGLLVMASFIAGIFTAGQAYFVCRMSGDVQVHCCCTPQEPDHHATISDRKMDCCDARTHAAPGNAVQPAQAPALDAALAVPLGAPVALVPRASVRDDAVSPNWTGPPLDRRRALISVFLL